MSATTLYRAYDAADQLLYVGVSCRGIRRFDEHADKSWWSTVETITVEHFMSRKAALDAEAWSLVNEAPLHNRAGVPTRTCGMPKPNGFPCRHTTDGGPCSDHGGLTQYELLRPVRQGDAA